MCKILIYLKIRILKYNYCFFILEIILLFIIILYIMLCILSIDSKFYVLKYYYYVCFNIYNKE